MKDLLAPLGLTPTPHQLTRLEGYAALLRQWNARINLVAESTLAELERRHILDCAQLAPHLPADSCRVLDVGAGAGLPGLVLAILAPQHQYTLAEKVSKKAAFLHTAAQELGLANVIVHAGRVESLVPRKYDIITCRAWASLADIVTLTTPLLAANGTWCLLKGEAYQAELEGCPSAQQMTIETHRSITNPAAVVMRLTPVPRETDTI
ncbi:MAG: 16S rRNA (guanine(527)-N(7))-methyltransferase RsmG [Pseudomonadaceae bacterium]|nr:16S rRNA (guanine(527)-N(7))-methyltransferase RsmG [Pseudomonadaceae bacterium]